MNTKLVFIDMKTALLKSFDVFVSELLLSWIIVLFSLKSGQGMNEASGQMDGTPFPNDCQVDDFRILDRYQVIVHWLASFSYPVYHV